MIRQLIGVGLYFAAGVGMLSMLGKPRSRFQWDEPPSPFRKAIVVTAWPVLLVMFFLSEVR